MKKKLFRSILFFMIIILTVSMTMIILVLNQNFLNIEEDQLKTQATLAIAGIKTDGETYLESVDSDDYRLTWIESNGDVIYDTEVSSSSMENHSSREEFQQALANGSGTSIRYSETVLQQNIYYAQKLDDGTVLRVSETYDTIWLLTLKLATPILWVYVAAIAVSAFLSNQLAKKLSDPINNIDLDHPLEYQGYDEIKPLLQRVDSQNKLIQEQVESLHQKKKEFETVTNNISEALILFNKEGTLLSVNNAALQLFQCDEDHLNKITENPVVKDVIGRVSKDVDYETTFQIDDAIIMLMGNPIRSHSAFTGISILAYDITETYEVEQQRKAFTANVSHELKTPLQSILGSAELLENHLVKAEDTDTFYKKIHQESARMLTLIDDIIRLSQLDESTDIEESNIDLKNIASEAYASLKDHASNKKIQIVMDCDHAMIRANSRLIYEIIYNLIDNAIRYSNENTMITVQTKQRKHHCYVSVKDQGIGIPLSDQSRIFERFYRVDKSHSRETGGTGLGLSIVKHAAKLSHGTIQLESEVNKGSKFTVTFPKA